VPVQRFCRACGAASEALISPGVIHFPTTAETADLIALFAGEMDVVRCEACGASLEIHPTVIVALESSPRLALLIGSALGDGREVVLQTLTSNFSVSEEEIVEYSRPEDLRAGLRKQFAPDFATVRRLVSEARRQNLDRWVSTNWRILKPTVFSAGRIYAAALANELLSPGYRGEMRSGSDALVRVLTKAQTKTWLALCASAIDTSYSGAFRDDLSTYIAEGATTREAADRFFRAVDEVALEFEQQGGEGWAGPDALYIIEAARARVCAVGGFDNPRLLQWAQLFFDFVTKCEGALYERYRISDDQARETLTYEASWRSVSRKLPLDLVVSDTPALDALDRAAQKAGYPGLADEFLLEGLITEAGVDFPVDALIADLERAAGSGTDAVMNGLALARRPLVRDGNVDDLIRVADTAIEALGKTDEGRARVETWLGAALMQLSLKDRFLERIGTAPAPWEFRISDDIRIALWLERLKALNWESKFFDEFCDQTEEIERLLPSSDDERLKWVFWHEQAVFSGQHGQPDKAASELENLLQDVQGNERLEVIRSLAETYFRLGRDKEALGCIEDAIALAVGPRQDLLPLLGSYRAVLLATANQEAEAMREVLGRRFDTVKNTQILSNEAIVWARVITNDRDVLSDERVARRVDSVISRLEELGASPPDARTEWLASSLLAHLNEALTPGDAEPLWLELLEYEAEGGAVPYPSTLLTLARYAYTRRDLTLGRQHLLQVPLAISAMFGAVRDIGSAAGALDFALPLLRDIGEVLLSEDLPSSEDLRLVGELQRDSIARAQSLGPTALRRTPTWAEDLDAARRGVPDDVLARLAPPRGRLAVIEWLEGSETFAALLTTVTSGAVKTASLDLPDVDLDRLARRMSSRLAGWHGGRPGDPFDLSDWQELDHWLTDQLSRFLEPNDHVIFIEHPRTSGIPWHVAARRWSSSYAASWTRMLSIASKHRERTAKVVGLVFVPRFREDARALNALRTSGQRTRAFSKSVGLQLSAAWAERCDHDEFARVMSEADVAKILCHGFVSPTDGEVALMLSHQGTLPLANAVASASDVGRRNRLTWRQSQMLPGAPAVVFSGACRSGISHSRGLGERLGLFSGLFQAGTSALVAPRWDVVAASVLPILDEALEQYLTTKMSLATVLNTACRNAEASEPVWLAWPLALEGDWR
jgi:CHAT domain